VKVRVYIDGFNFYYRALKTAVASGGGTFKWLDPAALARNLRSARACSPTSCATAPASFTSPRAG